MRGADMLAYLGALLLTMVLAFFAGTRAQKQSWGWYFVFGMAAVLSSCYLVYRFSEACAP